MRALIHVPVLHTEVDLGETGARLRQKQEAAGAGRDPERARLVTEALWRGVRERVLALDLPWENVLVYQDGLPCSGHELPIVEELAAKGSPNHALLLELVGRGAKLLGTEDPALLVRELELARRLVLAWDRQTEDERRSALEALRTEAAATLAARDAFIARRIAQTLDEGSTGILFLGVLHRVEKLLPSDIATSTIAFSIASKGGAP